MNGAKNETSPIDTDALHSRFSCGTSTSVPGQEREQDPRERADEREPARHGEVERVADDHPEEQLDQRDRDADLDRDGRGQQDGDGEKCCYRDVAHGSTS